MRTSQLYRALCLPVVLACAVLGSGRPATGAGGGDGAEPSGRGTTGGNDAVERRGRAYYHLLRATRAAHRGRIRDVLDELREATRAEPESAALRAEGAVLLAGIGQETEAVKYARAALRLDDAEPTARRLLAEAAARRALGGRGDERAYREAIEHLSVLAEDPAADEDVLGMLARLHYRQGDIDRALDVSRRLLQRRKGDVRIVAMIVQMLRQSGREPEALTELLNFLVVHGSDETLLAELPRLARTPEQWRAVAAMCAELLEQDAENAHVHRLRAEALLRMGDPGAAVDALEQARRIEPDDPGLLFQLAAAYAGVGRLADATEAARRLSDAREDDPAAKALLGESLARQRDYAAAVRSLNAALDGFREGAEPGRRDLIRRMLVRVHLERAATDAAAEVAAAFEERDRPEALQLSAQVALAAGDYPAAQEFAERLRTSGEEGLAALVEGSRLALQKRPGKARNSFKEATEHLGPSSWRQVGEVWWEAGRPDEGERALRSWIRETPDDADAHFVLGGYLERQGDFTAAERELRSALELDPEHALALNYLGYSLADRDERLDEALELIQRALEIEPWNGAYLDSLGWVYYRMGRFDLALEPLERAAREYPLDPTVLEHLGDVYDRLGRHAAAVETWRRALRAEPDDPEALRAKIEGGPPRAAADGGGARLP